MLVEVYAFQAVDTQRLLERHLLTPKQAEEEYADLLFTRAKALYNRSYSIIEIAALKYMD